VANSFSNCLISDLVRSQRAVEVTTEATAFWLASLEDRMLKARLPRPPDQYPRAVLLFAGMLER
jgi:hypothetical protein